MLIAEGKKQGRYYSPDPHPEAGHFYRSDHFSFAKVGVPAISFGDGNDLVNGGTERGEALAKEYTDKHYHQPSDEWLPTWDFRAWPRMRTCSTTSAATSPIRAPGPTGRPTANSARFATRRRRRGRAPAPAKRPRRRRESEAELAELSKPLEQE